MKGKRMKQGHNEKTEQELYEDQQFLRGFLDLKKHRSDMAGTKGEMNGVYKRLKDLNWSKKDVEFALTLEDKDVGQVIADFERKIRIAKLFGHALGRQLDLLRADSTTEEDKAYDEGQRVGRLRLRTPNPHVPGTPPFNRYEEGLSDGTKFINEDLSGAMKEAAE